MNNKGFTLIEFLIYISISVILISSLTLVTVNLLHARGSVAVMEEVSKNARFITDNIRYMVRIAESATVDVDGKLILDIPSPATYNQTQIYKDINDNAMIDRGSETALRINSNRIKVEQLEFTVSNDCVTTEVLISYYVPGGSERYSLEKVFQLTECIRR